MEKKSGKRCQFRAQPPGHVRHHCEFSAKADGPLSVWLCPCSTLEMDQCTSSLSGIHLSVTEAIRRPDGKTRVCEDRGKACLLSNLQRGRKLRGNSVQVPVWIPNPHRPKVSRSRVCDCNPPRGDVSLDRIRDSLAGAPARVVLAELTPCLRVHAVGHRVPLCRVRLRRLLRGIVAPGAISWFVPFPWL